MQEDLQLIDSSPASRAAACLSLT